MLKAYLDDGGAEDQKVMVVGARTTFLRLRPSSGTETSQWPYCASRMAAAALLLALPVSATLKFMAHDQSRVSRMSSCTSSREITSRGSSILPAVSPTNSA